jgi:HlyD family secretion protein
MDIPIEKKKISKSKLLMAGAALIIILLIIFVIVPSMGGSKLNVQKERLSISTVNNGIFQENIPVNGIVMPITTIYLDAVEGGRVEEKFVEDGAIMKQGEPILRLTNTY